ncbi:MAG: ATP synthase subunit I [Bradymonadia bacterium]
MHTLITSFVLVFLGATAASAALFGPSVALALGVGFATMTANVWLTRKTVRQFTSGGRTALVGLYLFKMTILFGLLYVFLHVLALNVIGLVVGLSLPMAVMVFAGSGWMTSEETSETGEETNEPIESGV